MEPITAVELKLFPSGSQPSCYEECGTSWTMLKHETHSKVVYPSKGLCVLKNASEKSLSAQVTPCDHC